MKKIYWLTVLLSTVFLISIAEAGQMKSGPNALRRIKLRSMSLSPRGHSFTPLSQSMLDNTFGTNGSVRTVISGFSKAYAVAIQTDGKIVAVGTSGSGTSTFGFTLARYDTNGSLDATFGTSGIVTTLIGAGYDEAKAVQILSDGKIVVAGWSENNSNDYSFAVARYNSNGTLDSTFGTNGSTVTAIDGGSGAWDKPYSMAIQSDGKIVVAGVSENSSSDYAFAIARFDSNGTLDNTFGTNGTVRTALSGGGLDDEAYSVAIQSDGKIVLGGFSENSSSDYAFALARYDTNGSIDSTFGTDGEVRTYIPGGDGTSDYGLSVAIQTDGKIVVAGASGKASSDYAFAVARYNSNGSLDNTFGTNGTVRDFISGGDSTDDEAYAVAIQSNGKIDAAGYSDDASGHYAFAVAQLNSDGSLDNTFSTNGTERSFISGGGSIRDKGTSVAIQSDGKIVVAGRSEPTGGGNYAFAVARYLSGSDNSLFVSATDFVATSSSGAVKLSWTTASEVENAGFNVLREDPGKSEFKLIASYTSDATLRGVGTSSTGRDYDYTDYNVEAGKMYKYEIESVSTNGTTKAVSTLSVTVGIPTEFALYQNYPNPFNPSTTIRFDLKEQSNVTLDIYNVLGQRVLEENYGKLNSGEYNKSFDMSRFASGVYFYRITAVGVKGDRFVSLRKMLELK